MLSHIDPNLKRHIRITQGSMRYLASHLLLLYSLRAWTPRGCCGFGDAVVLVVILLWFSILIAIMALAVVVVALWRL